MGLVSWYYNHRLDVANNLASEKELYEAERIYFSIIDKHIEAPICLARMYRNNALSIDLKIERLKQIEGLSVFVVSEKMAEYKQILGSHINNISREASRRFSAKDYGSAVKLAEAIEGHFKGNSNFADDLHSYKAHLYMEECLGYSRQRCIFSLQQCIKQLQAIKSSQDKVLADVYGMLCAQKKYRRGIQLLLPFKGLNQKVTDSLVDCIVSIIEDRDNETDPRNLKELCDDDEICALAARKLPSLSDKYASESHYDKSVRIDDYAAEYLYDDPDFNLSRFVHKLEECISRSSGEEIVQLLKSAKNLRLPDGGIDRLEKRTLEIIGALDVEKAIEICRLFPDKEDFALLYISKAKELARIDADKIDVSELRGLIGKYLSDEQALDTLADLAQHIPQIKEEYYEMAERAFDNGEPEHAYSLCAKLVPYPSSWMPLYLALREKEIAKEKSVARSVKFLKETIQEIIANVPNISESTDVKYDEFWSLYSKAVLTKAKSQPADKAIESLCEVRQQAAEYAGSISGYADISDKLQSQTAKYRWAYGMELETEGEYPEAIIQYDTLRNEGLTTYANRATIRSLICQVKSGSISDEARQEICNALKIRSYQSLREDLAFRYAIYLLKNVMPEEADKIICEYLPEETELKKICNNSYVEKAEQQLARLNSCIKQISDGTYPIEKIDEILELVNPETSDFIPSVIKYLPDIEDKVTALPAQIMSYALNKGFEAEDYMTVFRCIRGDLSNDGNAVSRQYLEDSILFRNIAIASFGLLEKKLDERAESSVKYDMYKLAVSICISAIYSDKLFIESLDQTKWDDPYTFTLKNSLGGSTAEDYPFIPENVNFDSPVDNKIVSIKDVQNSLLMRLEKALETNHPRLFEFYSEEKEAIEQLIGLNLDEQFIIATPNLAKDQSKAYKSIREALEYEYDQDYDNSEKVLATGVMYNLRGKAFRDYAETSKLVQECISALTSTPSEIRQAFENIDKIKKHDKLFAELKAKVSTQMNQSIKDEMEYDKFTEIYEVVCPAIGDRSLSMACSSYINGDVIERLNNNTLKEREGVIYLCKAYKICPDNFKVKKSLEAVLGFLARESEEKHDPLAEEAVQTVLRSTGHVFDETVENARVNCKLNDIVDKVNNDRMDEDEAFQTVYNMYKQMPNNDRICANLVTLCSICIHKYVIGYHYSKNATRILDSLKYDKSATFKRHAVKLGLEYLKILDQLPLETKELIIGSKVDNLLTSMATGRSLNENGIRLKKGLQYLKELGKQ